VFNPAYVGVIYTSFDKRWDTMVIAKRNVKYVNRHTAPLLLEDCTLRNNDFMWGAVVSRNCSAMTSTTMKLHRQVACWLSCLLSVGLTGCSSTCW
jgi:hypothetical protein